MAVMLRGLGHLPSGSLGLVTGTSGWVRSNSVPSLPPPPYSPSAPQDCL